MTAVGLGAVTIVSGLVVLIGWMGLVGRLHRNGFAGIRTPFTMASDENWDRTHRAAAPLLIFGGVASFMAGLAFLPFAAAGVLSTAVALAVTFVLAMILVTSSIAGWFVGVRSARRDLPAG